MAYVTGAWYPLVDLLAVVPPDRCEYCAPGLPCALHPESDRLAATDEGEYPQSP